MTRPMMKRPRAWDSRPIYAARGEDSGLIKFGVSYSPGRRCGQLQREVGEPVTLLGCLPDISGRYAEERLHARLSEHRASGEWYRPTSEIMEIAATAEPYLAPRARRALAASDPGGARPIRTSDEAPSGSPS